MDAGGAAGTYEFDEKAGARQDAAEVICGESPNGTVLAAPGDGPAACGKPAWTPSPPPVSAFAWSQAPCASAMAPTIDSPRPRPSRVPVRSAPPRWNGSNSWAT